MLLFVVISGRPCHRLLAPKHILLGGGRSKAGQQVLPLNYLSSILCHIYFSFCSSNSTCCFTLGSYLISFSFQGVFRGFFSVT